MADLATTRAAHRLDFADREGREVVVQHEAARLHAVQVLDALVIVARAERDADERLGLTAGEQDRTMRARQDAELDGDLAHGVGRTTVDALARGEDLLAADLRLQLARDLLDLGLTTGELLGDGGDDLGLGGVNGAVTLELGRDRRRGGHLDPVLQLLDLLLCRCRCIIARPRPVAYPSQPRVAFQPVVCDR